MKKSAIERFREMLYNRLNKPTEVEKSALNDAESECFGMAMALHDSLSSIIEDPRLDAVAKSDDMNEALTEFNEQIVTAFDPWSEGRAAVEKSDEPTEEFVEALKKTRDRIVEILKANGAVNADFESVFAANDITENMWRANDTLRSIFNKILADDKTTDKKAALTQAIDSYAGFLKKKINGLTIEKTRKLCEKSGGGEFIVDEKDEPAGGTATVSGKKKPIKKGGSNDMPIINMDNMTPEDQEILKSLEEKYGKDQDPGEAKPSGKVEKQDGKEDKVHPEVKKMMDEMEELKKQLVMKDLTEVAKKYECIGKKADELAPKLYDLKKSGESAYNDMIAMLDEMVNLQKQSGVFKEIGSNSSEGGADDLEGIVTELRKSMPEATRAELVTKAFETHPDLDPFTGKLNK